MKTLVERVLPSVWRWVGDRVLRWRTGTSEGQMVVLSVLLVLSVGLLVGSLLKYMAFPAATFVVPMLLGSLTLRYKPLLTLVLVDMVFLAVSVTNESVKNGMSLGRVSTLLTMAIIVAIFLFEASRRRTGLPGPVGEAMLVDLNDRLQKQGVVPPLPDGWRSQSAMRSAGGARFAGDFLVANLSSDRTQLEMVLVDVCGKGVAAGTQSLQLSGALGGLIGSLPPLGLFASANDYLLRQDWEEGFATAVHVLLHLDTGEYSIISAGHPPVLRWSAVHEEWTADEARGVALGIMPRPEFHQTVGRLEAGDALLFYTDGVVETRKQSVGEGVEWLRGAAVDVAKGQFADAARKILDRVPAHDDDRAVLVLDRKS